MKLKEPPRPPHQASPSSEIRSNYTLGHTCVVNPHLASPRLRSNETLHRLREIILALSSFSGKSRFRLIPEPAYVRRVRPEALAVGAPPAHPSDGSCNINAQGSSRTECVSVYHRGSSTFLNQRYCQNTQILNVAKWFKPLLGKGFGHG